MVRYRNDEGERDEAGMAYGNEHETGEGEGEIVAWTKWQYPHPFAKGNEQRGRQSPEGANVELWEEFVGKMEERKRRWVGEGEYCEFCFVFVLLLHSLFLFFSSLRERGGYDGRGSNGSFVSPITSPVVFDAVF